MGTVSPPALLGGLVHLDVLDDQVAGVEALGVGVGLGVPEEAEQEVGGLGGPAGLGDTELLAWYVSVVVFLDKRALLSAGGSVSGEHASSLPLLHTLFFPEQNNSNKSSRTLGSAAGAAGVAAHGDSLGLGLDVLEEGDGALELPAVDGLGGLTGVLEGHAEVGTAGAGRLCGRNLVGGVSNL